MRNYLHMFCLSLRICVFSGCLFVCVCVFLRISMSVKPKRFAVFHVIRLLWPSSEYTAKRSREERKLPWTVCWVFSKFLSFPNYVSLKYCADCSTKQLISSNHYFRLNIYMSVVIYRGVFICLFIGNMNPLVFMLLHPPKIFNQSFFFILPFFFFLKLQLSHLCLVDYRCQW